MTKTLEAVVRRRWLPPEYAVREVVAFERRFGEKHLALACHAALPLILTPELVNLIRINFLDSEDIPWIAESDLLLSPLCRPIQEDIYEVEPCVREVLLVELEDKFGWRIPFQLAEFLQFYLEKQPDWKQRPELTRTQKWIAKAYLNPDATIQEITDDLEKSLPQDNPVLGLPGQSYIPNLVEILAEPLERTNLWDERQDLVNISRVLAKLTSGEREGLKEEIEDVIIGDLEEGEFVLFSPVIQNFLEELIQELEVNNVETYKAPNAKLGIAKFFAYDGAWVHHDKITNYLSNKIKKSCRLLILLGITGIGKTALGERLAIELEDWFDNDWNYYLQENFDNEEQSADFASVAARLLEKAGEVVTPDDRKDTQRLLYRLVRHLQENRYLIQIDSLQKILQGNEEGRSNFIDEWWVKFFQLWLSTEICKSRLILTSQDLPAQIDPKKHYQNFLYCQPLRGLSEQEQLALFSQTGLDVSSEAEGKPYLERIGQAYEGHPLALRLIAGEIVNRPFNGNILAYWNKYGNEIEEVEKAIESAKSGGATVGGDDQYNLHQYTRSLRRNVKSRLENTFNRLRRDVRSAYLLLCESSVYRCEVPEDFWLSHLEDWDIDYENEKQIALDALRDRYLVEEIINGNNQVLLRQHNLIRSLSLEHLRILNTEDDETIIKIPLEGELILTKLGINTSVINSIKNRSKRTSYRAMINWLTKYKPPAYASNLQKIQGLLESFYHLCELEDWETASKIIVSRLETPTEEELYNQLGTWGYYKEQINLCNKLLKKLDFKLDIKLLNTLGNSDYVLGNYNQAINYLEQSVGIAEQINDSLGINNALINMGKVYEALGNYSRAIDCHKESLSIAKNINNRKGEAQALINLGVVDYDMANYVKSMSYSEEGLSIAREIHDKQSEGIALGNLGNVYLALGEYDRAIDFQQQSLQITKQIGNRYGEGEALLNLGNAFIQLNQYSEALEYLQASLNIFHEIGSRANEVTVLINLAYLYQLISNLNLAVEYCDRALAIAIELQFSQSEVSQEPTSQLREQNQLKNTRIFSNLNANDIRQLETALVRLFSQIDTVAGRKAILVNADIDNYFISNLDFNLNINEFTAILASKLKEYSASSERSNYHPLMALSYYLIQRRQQSNLDDETIDIFSKIYSIGQKNLNNISSEQNNYNQESSSGTNNKLSSYLRNMSQKLITEGCLSPQNNVNYENQQFQLVGKITNFELSFGLLNMRGDAFFIFSYNSSTNFKALKRYSSFCFDYAKQEATSSITNQLFNARVPSNICFSIAVVDNLREETKNSIRSENPLDYEIDSLWYLVPVVYSLNEQRLYYYDSPSSFWENFKGEIVWKKLREVIENILKP
ncbi:MAG: tetratricopeptide repeat protein [Calothrix sp. MO_167.B12]|nr:tetratricopeptide repeat protein [Calothrix sp. MO_167.B12]